MHGPAADRSLGREDRVDLLHRCHRHRRERLRALVARQAKDWLFIAIKTIQS
jgi:hypothetical protein